MPNYRRVFAEGHSYFLTVVTQNRVAILIKNIELLKKCFRLSKLKYCYTINAIVVLPDHFHIIITPQNCLDYPKIISHLKRSFVYGLDFRIKEVLKKDLSVAQRKRKNSGIWQKRFYEHTLRDEKDYQIKFNYIHFNPVKHRLVKRVRDWEYSSFAKYVKMGIYDINWIDFDENIDFE